MCGLSSPSDPCQSRKRTEPRTDLRFPPLLLTQRSPAAVRRQRQLLLIRSCHRFFLIFFCTNFVGLKLAADTASHARFYHPLPCLALPRPASSPHIPDTPNTRVSSHQSVSIEQTVWPRCLEIVTLGFAVASGPRHTNNPSSRLFLSRAAAASHASVPSI